MEPEDLSAMAQSIVDISVAFVNRNDPKKFLIQTIIYGSPGVMEEMLRILEEYTPVLGLCNFFLKIQQEVPVFVVPPNGCVFATVPLKYGNYCGLYMEEQISGLKKGEFIVTVLKDSQEGGELGLHIVLSKQEWEARRKELSHFSSYFQNPQFTSVFVKRYESCHSCRKKLTKRKKCSACETCYYCDAECQRKHWEKHRIVCKKMKELTQPGLKWFD